MSEVGKKRAQAKAELKPDGGMFPLTQRDQHERRSAQAFCKMLGRSPKRYDPGFVNWVEQKARQECGDLFQLVEVALEKRRKANAKLQASIEANKQKEG